MRKPITLGLIALFFTAIICFSCSRKGYYPHKKLPKKDCGCGSFGYVDHQITADERKDI